MTAPRYEWQPTSEEIAARAGITPDQVERMDQNTSPTPTEWALDVVRADTEHLNEYPAASYASLCEAAADRIGVPARNVVPGAGVDELILLAARAFLRPGATAVVPTPAYPMYDIASLQVGAVVVSVPAASPHFGFPAAEVAAAASHADVTWLCVPSNPLGNRAGDDDIASVVEAAGGIVVIDAAYAEFADDSWGTWIDRHDNLLVMQTLSKAHGLAGARVGFAFGHPDLVDAIDAVRPPGSIATLSVSLAVSALRDRARVDAIVDHVTAERSVLAESLTDLGIEVLPSTTNFLLCRVGREAHTVERLLMDRGIVVRKFAADGPLAEHLRFTVRTKPAHDRLVEALSEILGHTGGRQ